MVSFGVRLPGALKNVIVLRTYSICTTLVLVCRLSRVLEDWIGSDPFFEDRDRIIDFFLEDHDQIIDPFFPEDRK